MISTRSVGLLIDTVVCLTLAKWETVSGRFGGYLSSVWTHIAESKDTIEVTAELPGVDEKDLDVTIANGMLTIRGEKRTERDS